jgi:hypothetical protein
VRSHTPPALSEFCSHSTSDGVEIFAVADDPTLESLATAKFPNPPLSSAEIKLVQMAPGGFLAVCGPNNKPDDSSNDPSMADADWKTERTIRADLIRWICVDRHARELVDPRGIRVLGAILTGELDLSYVKVPFPLSFQCCRLAEKANLHAVVASEIDLERTWTGPIDASNADVKASMKLRDTFRAKGEVNLREAKIGGDLDCRKAIFENPPRKGADEPVFALNADNLNVTGDISLSEGFRAEGAVRLIGAKIGGELTCAGGHFINPVVEGVKGSGDAINADRAVVTGTVFLSEGFEASGRVSLIGAQIGTNLRCTGGKFKNQWSQKMKKGGLAITANGVLVQGDIFLDGGFRAEGEVRILNARVNGDLVCVGGTFHNPSERPNDDEHAGEDDEPGDALSADGIQVNDVNLKEGLETVGRVRLSGARIGGDLDCTGAKIEGLLLAQRTIIQGNVFLCGLKEPSHTKVNLIQTTAGAYADDKESWPDFKSLRIHGFVYGAFADSVGDPKTRLQWLARQPEFNLQPYQQLAKLYRENGSETGARRVLYEMERRRRGEEKRLWKPPAKRSPLRRGINWIWHYLKLLAASIWNPILRITIGYGYYPGLALVWLLLVVALGWPVFRHGYFSWNIAPIDKDAYKSFQIEHSPPANYDRFRALVYSLENSFPLVKLGLVDRWQPNSPPWASKPQPDPYTDFLSKNIASPEFLVIFRYFQIIAGWFLATMGVVGITGVVRKD